MQNICIISHQHLSRNPRVLKEAIALNKIGLNVSILTNVYDKNLLNEDIELLKNTTINCIYYNNLLVRNIQSISSRTVHKFGRLLNKIGIENKYAFGYAPNRCLKMATEQDADLYICHQELPTYIGTKLINKNYKVAFDFEDFYSEDLLEHDQKYRPQKLLENAEKFALTLGNLIYTTSSPMAEGLATKYNTNQPEVIYNSFKGLAKVHPVINQGSHIRLIWLSQTIGPGRGLENIVQAINNIHQTHFELNLRGSVSEEYQRELANRLTNKKHIINFLPIISNDDIQIDLQDYDIGLALELDTPLSRGLTLTNKIFHYLSAGLPVIASATLGQLSLKYDFENSIYYFNNDFELINLLSNISSKASKENKEEILSRYQKNYDWCLVEKKLQDLIKDIL